MWRRWKNWRAVSTCPRFRPSISRVYGNSTLGASRANARRLGDFQPRVLSMSLLCKPVLAPSPPWGEARWGAALCAGEPLGDKTPGSSPLHPPPAGGGHGHTEILSQREPYRGTIGRVICDGYWTWCRMVCNAGFRSLSSATRFPVLGLRSKRGKLLLAISTLMRCPALKTLLVAQRSSV